MNINGPFPKTKTVVASIIKVPPVEIMMYQKGSSKPVDSITEIINKSHQC